MTERAPASNSKHNAGKIKKTQEGDRSECWRGLVIYLKREVLQLRAKREKELPADKAARSTARATWLVAGFTVALVVVGYFQWRAIRGQLTEMQGSGKQTDKLICLYRKQLDQLTKQTSDTHDLAVAAKVQADRTKTIADEAVVQAQAARSGAVTARDALQLGNRPWIKITPRIIEPLTFNIKGSSASVARMTTENTIENVGPGVALNVLSWEDVIPVDPDGSLKTARARQEEWCGAHRHIQNGEMSGSVLFPHDPLTERMIMGPFMAKVNEVAAKNTLLPGKVAFVLVGCVCYRSSFEPATAPGHQTRFIYRLGIPISFGGFNPYIAPTGVATEIRLVEAPDVFSAD